MSRHSQRADPPELTAVVPRAQLTIEGPSPAVPALVVLTGKEAGRRFAVASGGVTLGRDGTCEVRLDDRKVSRHHARITTAGDRWQIVDLGSRNGTTINGEPTVGPTLLAFGDRVQLSPETLLLFTRRDPLEDRALHRQQMEIIGQLAAGTAHDFNNMLSVILTSLSHVLGLQEPRSTTDPDVLECLSDARSAALRASELTARLLVLARRRDDAGPLSARFDVSRVCREVLHLVQRTFERSIRVEPDIDPGLHVEGDASAIHQLLMNLIINARDAMPQGGTLGVTLHAAPSRREAVITVTDTGIGMDERTRARLFEPFFTTKSIGAGTGLGLATVYEVATRHGGSVEVESALGKGSTFRVLLPLTAVPHGSEVTAHGITDRTPLSAAGTAARILVVDDEEFVRRSLGRILKAAGHTVLYAADGLEALRVVEAGPAPDLVLLDLDMPNMGGAATLRRLRQLRSNARVILLSGYYDDVTRKNLLEQGAWEFLGKPIEAARLRSAVECALRGTSAREVP